MWVPPVTLELESARIEYKRKNRAEKKRQQSTGSRNLIRKSIIFKRKAEKGKFVPLAWQTERSVFSSTLKPSSPRTRRIQEQDAEDVRRTVRGRLDMHRERVAANLKKTPSRPASPTSSSSGTLVEPAPQDSPVITATDRYTDCRRRSMGCDLNQFHTDQETVAERNQEENTSISLKSQYINDYSLRHVVYPKQVTRLDLENNRLCFSVPGLLDVTFLESINLCHNKICDTGVCVLMEGLVVHGKIRKLNLAHNKLAGTAKRVFQLFAECKSLEYLDLSWNALGYKGVCSFSLLLDQADHGLKELNLASNCKRFPIDKTEIDKQASLMAQFAKSLALNTTLRHIDISWNSFCTESIQILAEKLNSKNHSIKGLHLAGNMGRVDARGFVVPLYQVNNGDFRTNCWLCEDWKPVRFIYKTMDSEAKICVHLPQLNWEDCLLYSRKPVKNEECVFETTIVLPVNSEKVYFFLTVNGETVLSKDWPTVTIEQTIVGDNRTSLIEKGAYANLVQYNLCDYSDIEHTDMYCIPRLQEQEIAQKLLQGYYSFWTLKQSEWRGRRVLLDHDSSQLKAAFAYDWEYLRQNSQYKEKLFDNVAEKNQMVFSEYYHRMISWFYYYAALTDAVPTTLSLGGVLCFISDFGVVELQADLEKFAPLFETISPNSDPIQRWQFVDFVLSLAVHIHPNLHISKAYSTLMETLSRYHDPSVYVADVLRSKYLYTSHVDDWLKENATDLRYIFSAVKSKSNTHISLSEWIEWLDSSGMFEYNIIARPVACILFVLSTPLPEPCSTCERTMEYEDFLEATLRLAAFIPTFSFMSTDYPKLKLFQAVDSTRSWAHLQATAVINIDKFTMFLEWMQLYKRRRELEISRQEYWNHHLGSSLTSPLGETVLALAVEDLEEEDINLDLSELILCVYDECETLFERARNGLLSKINLSILLLETKQHLETLSRESPDWVAKRVHFHAVRTLFENQ